MVAHGVRPLSRLYQLLWITLDWVYPPACGGCGRAGTRWCEPCQVLTEPISPPLCPSCGQTHSNANRCPRCRTLKPAFHALRSWAQFSGPLQQALHGLKYRRDLGLGEALSSPLADYYRQLAWKADFVVPVPLGNNRLAERGYNQVALIGFPFALTLGLPYKPRALCRVRETRSQVGLSQDDRKLNVQGAFSADPHGVDGRVVLVLDDVTTTGATLDACARALHQAGARQVLALTVARAVHKPSIQKEAI